MGLALALLQLLVLLCKLFDLSTLAIVTLHHALKHLAALRKLCYQLGLTLRVFLRLLRILLLLLLLLLLKGHNLLLGICALNGSRCLLYLMVLERYFI